MVHTKQIAREIAANVAMRIPPVRAWRVRRGRTAHLAVTEQAQLMRDQFDWFAGNVGRDRIHGATILEIGPGDSLPLGLLFLEAGAKQYVAVDRFMGDVDGLEARALYRELGRDWLPTVDQRVRLLRTPIEQTPTDACADLILSFDVMEHVSNVVRAYRSMAHMLAPDGLMLHRIDYGPHQFWPVREQPMEFLALPDTVWHLMGGARGFPNRVRHREHIRAAHAAGLVVADRPTRRFAAPEVARVGASDDVWDGELLASKTSQPTFHGAPFPRHVDRMTEPD